MNKEKLTQEVVPILFLIMLIVLYLILNFYNTSLDMNLGFISYLLRILLALIVLFITRMIVDFTKGGVKEFLDKIKYSDAETVAKVYGYIIWLLGLFLSLSILVENIGTFVMSLGLIGFGLTFAMQTPLSCLVAWIMIVTHKPFKINDRIKIGDLEGDVIDITIMYILIREVGVGGTEPTGRIVTFPNSMLLTKSIVNYTRDIKYIWDEISVAVTYESDRELAEKIVKECTTEVVGDMMKEGAEEMKKITVRKYGALGRGMRDYIHLTPQIRIDLADSWFNVIVRYIVEIRKRRRIRTEIQQTILDRFKETEGIWIAYPHIQIVPGKEEELLRKEIQSLKKEIEKSNKDSKKR